MKKIYKKNSYLGLVITIIMSFFAFSNATYAATYYLDAVNGSDANSGSISEPWQTLVKARETTISGDTIYLKAGDYGAYTETNHSARTDYTTYQALENETVHFDRIGISNDSITDTYLKFVGINIKPDWVDPCSGGQIGCDDPQYPESTQSTYSKTATPFFLEKARKVQLINSVIEGQDKYLTAAGVYVTLSEDITISGCDISNITHAIRFISACTNITVHGNHIHNLAGTGINTVGTGYVNMVYENNHIHNGLHPSTLDYYPKALGANVHGSGISIRDGNTTVRGNIIHDTGTSSGIMLYEDDAGNDYVNENVLIENNLIYDIGNVYVLRLYDTGPNVVVRNNTFIANSRYDVNDGYAQYRTAFVLHSVDEQNGPASVNVHDNIMIGIAGLNSPYVTENNNIVWSTADRKCTGDPSLSETTYVFSCTYSNRSSEPLYNLFSQDPNMTFENRHGLVLDFTATPELVDGYTFDGSGIGFQYVIQKLFRSDVDDSSQVNTTDALLTLRNSLGLSMNGTAWRVSATTGDVNCDGVSNSTDALLILRYSLGLSMSGTSWCE